MKTKEFAKLGQYLTADLPGFTSKGQMLFMQPVGHTLRAIFFDGSINPRRFYVQVFIQPLFVPAEHLGFNIGWRLGGGSHTWDVDAPDLLAKLSAAIKREALPFLSRIRSPRDVADVATSLQKSKDPYVQQATAYALARAGDFEKATDALDRLVGLLDLKVPWDHELASRAQALKSQIISNAAIAQKQLETWEGETVRKLSLEDSG